MAKKASKTTTKKKAAKKTTVKKTAKKTVKATKKTAAKKAVKKSTAAKKKPVKKKSAAVKKTASPKTITAKKKSVKKKSARRLSKSPLSAKDLEYFRDLLIEKQKEIVGDVNAMEAEALRKSRLEAAGDLSSMPIHMADMGTDNFEQEFSLGLMDSERKLLHDIILALNKIDLGTYGICEGTSKPIGKPRLEANPWAKYCIEYAQMVEDGLVIEGERVDDYDEDDEDQFDGEDYDSDEEEIIVDDEDEETEDVTSVYDLFEDDEDEDEDF